MSKEEKIKRFVEKVLEKDYPQVGRIRKYFLRKLLTFQVKYNPDLKKIVERLPE